MLFKVGLIAALAGSAVAHMATIEPCPRFNPNCSPLPTLPYGAAYDYNYMKSPIPADGILCKSNTPWPKPVATWTAGQTVTVKFQPGGAAHGGGHCQFSLSYDGGKTFVVVHEELKYCFFGQPAKSNAATILQYDFQLPSNVPSSDSVIFAWSWVNAIGNREFYMNCADITISGGSSTSYVGKRMVIANHNGYPTIPEFGDNYDTGLEYYQNSPNVTVSASGSGGYGTVTPSKAASSSGPAYTTTPVYSTTAIHAHTPAPEYSASTQGSAIGHNAGDSPAISSAPEYSAVLASSEAAVSTTPAYTALPAPTEEPSSVSRMRCRVR